jgi:uncharacterized protein (TIGR02246 family)
MRILLLALTLLTPLGAHGQQPDQLFTATRQQLDVTKILLAQQAAWNKGDLDAYLSFYKDAPDTVAVLATPIRGLPAIRSLFHANFPTAPAMGTLEQTEVQVRSLGENFALATGKYDLDRPKKLGGSATGTFTEILEKTDKGWQLIYSQTT